MLEEQLAIGIVVGCSLFGIAWGAANTAFVSQPFVCLTQAI